MRAERRDIARSDDAARDRQDRAAPKRKVVVVGAGPAGLEAARVAKSRGHDVVLFEKNEYVGGQIMLAAKAPQREQMAGIVRWFDMETKRLGVDRRLGVAADDNDDHGREARHRRAGDGRQRHSPAQVPAWGVEEGLAVSSWDILSGKVEPGKNVLVYDGMSTHAGAGVADFMASRGSTVEIVTPDVKVADDVGGTTFPIFYRRLYAQGVIMTPNYWLDQVYRRRRQEDRRDPQRIHGRAGRTGGRPGGDRERHHCRTTSSTGS